MKITVEEALIKTATVEIKTLTVSGRQVTLAVFRQLQEESVIDYQLLRLNGIVWGKVNYHTPDCTNEQDRHIHLIWQSGTELRRSCVKANSAQPVIHSHQHALEQALYAFIVAAACEEGLYFKKTLYEGISFNFKGIQGKIFVASSDLLIQLLSENQYIGEGQGDVKNWAGKTHKQSAQECIEKLRQKITLSEVEAIEKVIISQKELEAYVRDWKIFYEKLKEVQQLFIAV